MNRVLPWIKSNIVTVVMLVLAIAAVVAAPILSGRWSDGVRREAESRAGRLSQIASLERTNVNLVIPGQPASSVTTVVNPQLLERYRELSKSLHADASRIRAAAIEFNRKERGVLVPRLFPTIPERERDTLPLLFVDEVQRAYDELLRRVRAGAPPSPEAVVEAVATREEQFISNNLRKQSRSDLDAAELRDLRAELTKARLAKYAERAEDLSFYCRVSALPVPVRPGSRLPTMMEMFEWQWNFWLVEDVLSAMKLANESADSVVTAPVKHVLSVRILDPVQRLQEQPDGGTGGAPGLGAGLGSGAGGFGGMPAGNGAGATPPPATEGPLGPPAIDLTSPVARDFRRSITGRSTNHLYDVRRAEVILICTTTDIPLVIDAFARRNFMTVLDLEMLAADPFDAIEDGYLYGTSPVSEIRLIVETVWLREWTAAFMPAQVRDALGIGSSSGDAETAPMPQAPGAPTGRSPEEELEDLLRSQEP